MAYVGVKERTSLETGTSHFGNHLLTIEVSGEVLHGSHIGWQDNENYLH